MAATVVVVAVVAMVAMVVVAMAVVVMVAVAMAAATPAIGAIGAIGATTTVATVGVVATITGTVDETISVAEGKEETTTGKTINEEERRRPKLDNHRPKRRWSKTFGKLVNKGTTPRV